MDSGISGPGLTNAPVKAATAAASAPYPTGKGQAMLGDKGGGGGLVVDRQGGNLNADIGQDCAGALERRAAGRCSRGTMSRPAARTPLTGCKSWAVLQVRMWSIRDHMGSSSGRTMDMDSWPGSPIGTGS